MTAAFFVYFSIVLVCVLFSKSAIYLKNKLIKFIVSYLIPVSYAAIFLGGRFKTGSDWENYKEYYDEILKYGMSFSEVFSSSLEPAYLFLNKFVAFFDLGSSYFFAIVTIVHLTAVYFIFRKSPKLLPYGLFFYLMGNMSLDVNVVRQSIAFSCVALSSVYVTEKRYVAFLLFMLAICFHYSALFVAPILFLDKSLFRFIDNPILVVVLYALTIVLATPINDVFSGYLQLIEFGTKYAGNAENLSEMMDVSSGYGLLSKHFVNFALIYLWCKIRIIVSNQYYVLIYRTCVLGFLWANIFGISVFLSRLTLYYTFFTFVMWTFIAYSIFNNVNLKKYRLFVICVILLDLLLFAAGILHSSGGCSPYTFRWIG